MAKDDWARTQDGAPQCIARDGTERCNGRVGENGVICDDHLTALEAGGLVAVASGLTEVERMGYGRTRKGFRSR